MKTSKPIRCNFHVIALLWVLAWCPGCTQDSLKSSADPPSVESLSANDNNTVADVAPQKTDVLANKKRTEASDALESLTLPVLGEFPPTLFKDHHGFVVGKRDLHGMVCLVRMPSDSSSLSAAAEQMDFSDLASEFRETPTGKYFSTLQIHNPASLQKSFRPSAPSDFAWTPISPIQDSFWDSTKLQDKIILLDPIGRVRGVFASSEASALRSAVNEIWKQQVPFLNEALHSTWMAARRDAQLEQKNSLKVRHDFQFTDVRRKTGIRFLNQIVDDAAKDYKGVHYDHGNGLTIADVDGDGFIDIYFVNQLGQNTLYRNNGNGTFTDITEQAGVKVGDRICVTASFADIDNDGDADLYVTSVRKGNLLFMNDGTGNFSDATTASGIGYQGHSSGAVFFDFDLDGLLDLYLCNVGQYTTEETGSGGYYIGFKDAFSGHLKPERTESSRVYRNIDGKSFQDVTEAFAMTEDSWTGDAAACDFNSDGWPDLYVLDMQGNDEYYENQQGAGFVKKSREVFPKTPWGAMGVAIADFDNDLDLDIFVTDMHSDMSKDILADIRSEVSMNTFYLEEKDKATMKLPESLLKSEGASIYGNAFFKNDGRGGFTEVSADVNAENYWPWGLTTGDLNADGFEDAFVTSSMNYPFRYGVNSLLLNDGHRFHDAEFIVGAEPRPAGRTAQPWMQIDCDASDGELMKKVTAGKAGEITVWGALGSRASVFLDIDNDGDLDIVTNEFNDMPLVLESDLAQRHDVNFVKVRLTGTRSNRAGVGARLTVSTTAGKKLCLYDGKVGYLSQGIPELYVGLGSSKEVLAISVTWPNGAAETIDGPWASGSIIELTESASEKK